MTDYTILTLTQHCQNSLHSAANKPCDIDLNWDDVPL
jgi:hypothetical protein